MADDVRALRIGRLVLELLGELAGDEAPDESKPAPKVDDLARQRARTALARLGVTPKPPRVL